MSEIGTPGPSQDALVDLLIKQATEGLTVEEQATLDSYAAAQVLATRRELEGLLATLTVGILSVEPAPAALQTAIEQRAAAAVGARATGNVAPLRSATAPSVVPAPVAVAVAKRSSGTYGWLAAAACLVLALFSWLRPLPPAAPPVAQVPVTAPPAVVEVPVKEPPPPTPAEARDAMLARAETVKVTLAATKDPAGAGVTADVVWDPEQQNGFLHLVGLKANDPQVQQYQAWIFDGQRDKRYPVSTGIFDVPADATDIVIPLHASVPVRLAKAFAVTVEKPGGVVVPDKAHVVVLGAAG